MAYLYIFLVTIAFSFIGVLNKSAGLMVSPDIISFMRFFIGAVFLICYLLFKKKPVRLRLAGFVIWAGGIAKALNYITENYGIASGFSFGNIVVWPVQCVVAFLFSIFFLKERLTKRSVAGSILCIVGIGVITWNGTSISEFMGSNFPLTLLFIISGIGAAGFLIAIKLLTKKMAATESNLAMFTIGSVITFIPIPFTGTLTGEVHLISIVALLLMGLITGGGFLLVAEALKKVPLFLATIIQSTTVIFTLLWAILFYQEPVTVYISAGTIIFIAGMLFINIKIPGKKI